MKFISQYRKLRVVLMPTRKIFHKEGQNDEVQVIPPIVAEFEGGQFDTEKAFNRLHQIQEDAGQGARLESEDKLIHLLKGHPDFGKSYTEYFIESKESRLNRTMDQLRAQAVEYGMSVEDLAAQLTGETPETLNVQTPKAPEESQTLQTVKADTDLDAMKTEELKEFYLQVTGKKAGRMARASIIEALNDLRSTTAA